MSDSVAVVGPDGVLRLYLANGHGAHEVARIALADTSPDALAALVLNLSPLVALPVERRPRAPRALPSGRRSRADKGGRRRSSNTANGLDAVEAWLAGTDLAMLGTADIAAAFGVDIKTANNRMRGLEARGIVRRLAPGRYRVRPSAADEGGGEGA